MPIKTNEREYRNAMEFRALPEVETEESDNAESRKIVEGYATTFSEPYELFRNKDVIFSEAISPDAFVNTDMSDVIMQYNHEGRVFARISNGTLELEPDEHGLKVRADLGGTEIGRNLYEEIRGGYTDKMSFGFTVSGDTYDEVVDDNGVHRILRTINAVSKLYDVSAVSIPANDATSISVRNLSDGVIEKVEAERLEREMVEVARKRIAIRAKALNTEGWK